MELELEGKYAAISFKSLQFKKNVNTEDVWQFLGR